LFASDERAPERRYRYSAFVDPSGGMSDAFTLAISHREGDMVKAEFATLAVWSVTNPRGGAKSVVVSKLERR